MGVNYKRLTSDSCDEIEQLHSDLLNDIEFAASDYDLIEQMKMTCARLGIPDKDPAILHGLALGVGSKTDVDIRTLHEAIEIDASK